MSENPDTIAFERDSDPADMMHLRPTSGLELMDHAFGILRIRPGLFLGLGALSALPALIAVYVYVATHRGITREDDLLEYFSYQWAAWLPSQWPVAAIVAAAFQTHLFPRRPLQLWTALRACLPRLPHFILTRLLVTIFLLFLGVEVPSMFLKSGIAPGLAIAVAAWSVIACIYFVGTLSLVPAVTVIERRAFFRAMTRSTELMRIVFRGGILGDSALRRLVLLALFPMSLALMNLVFVESVNLALTGRMSAITRVSLGMASNSVIPNTILLVDAVVSFFTGALNTAWFSAALVLLYSECRMWREALDLQVRLLSHGEMNETHGSC